MSYYFNQKLFILRLFQICISITTFSAYCLPLRRSPHLKCLNRLTTLVLLIQRMYSRCRLIRDIKKQAHAHMTQEKWVNLRLTNRKVSFRSSLLPIPLSATQTKTPESLAVEFKTVNIKAASSFLVIKPLVVSVLESMRYSRSLSFVALRSQRMVCEVIGLASTAHSNSAGSPKPTSTVLVMFTILRNQSIRRR